MKFIVNCKLLKTAVSKVSSRVRGQSPRCVIPLDIEMAHKSVILRANNSEIRLAAQTSSTGLCSLKSKLFIDVLKTYPDKESITVDVTQKGMLINGFSLPVDEYHSSGSNKNKKLPICAKLKDIYKQHKKNIEKKKPKPVLKKRKFSSNPTPKEGLSEHYRIQGVEYLDCAKSYQGIVRHRDLARSHEKLAWDFFQKAADLGNHLAELELGKFCCSHDKEEEGREWYRKAAEGFRKEASEGDPLGEYGLGEIYSNGYGVPPDEDEADKWYQKARDNKQRSSEQPLGRCPADFSGAYTFPDGVTAIGKAVFADCSALTSVTIPASVTSIAEGIFIGCSALNSINVDPDNPKYASVGGVLFDKGLTALILCPSRLSGTYAVPSSVISICDGAFYNCSSLTSVTIPKRVKYIGTFAFYGCSTLSSITIPESITSIGIFAFHGCCSLASVSIPDGVTSIGESAFECCDRLNSVTIPDSVTSIGDRAFVCCTALTSVTIPYSVINIGRGSFHWCSALTSINVHRDNPNYASDDGVLFDKELTLIQCPSGFYGAYTIPDGTTSIDDLAFENCSVLTSVTIPDSVTSIGDSAFSNCSSLASVLFTGDAPAICSNAFECTTATIYYCPGTSGWGPSIAGRPAVKQENTFDSEEKQLCGMGTKVTEEFDFTDDDMYAIEIAKNVARRFLKHPNIDAREVIGLGNALYALERLPLVTPGSSCEFGVEYRAGTKEFSEMRYIDFRISESSFEISKGGSVYNKAVGGDSFSEPGWSVEVGGGRSEEGDLYGLEDTISEYLNLGAEISVRGGIGVRPYISS